MTHEALLTVVDSEPLPIPNPNSDRHLFIEEARGGHLIDKDTMLEEAEATKHTLDECYREAGLPRCVRREKIAAFEATIFGGDVVRQLTAITFMENLHK